MKITRRDLAFIVVILALSITLYIHVQEHHLPPGKNIRKDLPEKVDKYVGLYVPPKAAATVSQTREESATVPEIKLPNIEAPLGQTQEPPAGIAGAEESQQMRDFIMWCKKRGIKLVGIKKEVNDFYYNGAAEEDFLPFDDIPNLHEVAAGLYEIPDPLLEAMEGKTFYLSHLRGRGYTVLGSWSDKNILANMDRGCILEQPLTKRQTIHEFAHILDYHGIQGVYEDPNNYWWYLKGVRDEIFAVGFAYDPRLRALPAGYMDVYSTANAAENFAQHFMYYILYGPEFRKKAQDDVLLQKKYDFFKKDLFNYLDYGL